MLNRSVASGGDPEGGGTPRSVVGSPNRARRARLATLRCGNVPREHLETVANRARNLAISQVPSRIPILPNAF